jgi:hypothetical protein
MWTRQNKINYKEENASFHVSESNFKVLIISTKIWCDYQLNVHLNWAGMLVTRSNP